MIHRTKIFITFIVLFYIITVPLLSPLTSQLNKTISTTNSEYKLESVLELDGVIWSFDFISKTEVILTIRHGEMYYIDLSNNIQKQISVPNVHVNGQGGLLDVHFRQINNTNYIYYTFSTISNGQLTTALARGVWANEALTNIETIFTAKTTGSSGRHFGSRLLFRENRIFMTIGDRGERDYAQDLSYHNGKILRLDLAGKSVSGNPFEKQNNALPEIWSYGHRNPQGIDLHPITGELFSCEFGPRGGDELNLIKIKKNYGWPIITFGREYWGPKIGDTHNPEMEQPITYWTPSISPSGMAFYNGDKIPKWKNSLFLANLSSTHLRRLVLIDNKVVRQEPLFKDIGERFRHVRTGLDGYLYFSTDSGKLIKVSVKN